MLKSSRSYLSRVLALTHFFGRNVVLDCVVDFVKLLDLWFNVHRVLDYWVFSVCLVLLGLPVEVPSMLLVVIVRGLEVQVVEVQDFDWGFGSRLQKNVVSLVILLEAWGFVCLGIPEHFEFIFPV